MVALIDLQGQRFGRLVVTSAHFRRGGQTRWPCTCDCGNQASVWAHYLTAGTTRSCGCLSSETTAARNLKHGQNKRGQRAPEYGVWSKMRDRCTKPSNKSYAAYGGRGITVCERWQSFEHFIADMGPRPSPGHQIERIDNDGPYAPSNCRWATRAEQASNRRDNAVLAHDGQRATVAEWSRRTGLAQHVIWQRVNRLGWPVSEALTTPVRPQRRR